MPTGIVYLGLNFEALNYNDFVERDFTDCHFLSFCLSVTIAPNGFGAGAVGLSKIPLSARTQTLFIAKFNLFCPTKLRLSSRPFVPKAKKTWENPACRNCP